MTVAFIRRARIESGTARFSEANLRTTDWPLTISQRHALMMLREEDEALADEIEQLWSRCRSYRRFLHVSDKQMCRIMNGLNAVSIDLLNQVEKADKEIDGFEFSYKNVASHDKGIQ